MEPTSSQGGASNRNLRPEVPKETDKLLSGDKQVRQYRSFMSADSAGDVSFSDLLNGLPHRLTRHGSVILAETGERTRRFTLPDQETDDFDPDVEAQPLIDRPRHRSTALDLVTSSFNATKSFLIENKFVIKCSIAYMLASLAVYNTRFSQFLGKSDSKHVVATVAVYFHPSRTFGSMHQSLIFVVTSIIFSFSVSLITTFISSQFHHKGWEEVGSIINLLSASVSLGMVSYMKQKMNHPTFNTACSLSILSIVSAIVKEGSQNGGNLPLNRLFTTFKIICCGSLLTILVCYIIIPTSATAKLKKDLNDSCSLMSSYLSRIESAFINRSDGNSNEINTLSSKIKKNTTTLNGSLEEAKYELYLAGREQEYRLFSNLVRSAQLLNSQLGGLKGSAEMQWSTLEDDRSELNSSASSVKTISSDSDGNNLHMSESTATLDEMAAINPTQLFDLFIYYLGPSIRSFSYTIRGVLDGMPFEDKENYPTKETYHYRKSLELARDLFTKKYERALTKLYDQKIFKVHTTIETKIDEEEVAASCGNFASLLSQYSKELDNFVRLLTEYSELLEDNPRSWNWLKFWKRQEDRTNSLMKKVPDLNAALHNLNVTMQQRTDRTDQRNTYSYKIWKFFSFFRKVEVQFGIRVGLGAFVLGSLAYLPKTKVPFMEWRGEWALVTYCIIMNKSLGGTTMTVNWRILGTFIGAFGAYLIWTLSDGNVIALCLTGWILSLFCFHIILNWKDNNAYGRFILLTYNVTALYSFNITRQDDLEDGDTDPVIRDIAIHRFFGIIAGVIWALIMTVSFLPITARTRLKRGLSLLWLRLGVIWNMDPLGAQDDVLVGLADQGGINQVMRELELLLKQAPKETRLKGTFRLDVYKKLMKSTERIIDSFQNMNTMIQVETKLSEDELIVLSYTQQEREELQNRIFLIFYMISSSITLGFPLPAKPASTEHAKDRIMVKLGEIRNKRLLSNEDYVLLYSYVLNSNVITRELDKLIHLLGDLYGLVDKETFEI
ncbi:putative membrane protein [Wickerhamomyces ciferrii]|uniref:Membrane protein n=1 Tax=Wickerhamomyces ciferrii (strain ATCC 14091 / BCRC 22168 / CBS 111 / JCM 3599 / NBRC 0793 / NRRL Y-1031 F-60-10) TaxID=1206466 RepID=K0L0L8_WICCF|nr:uncharacterized protein BN7_6595 [Wickerhamomyces ciferrii]CCH46988.1 putative membrane protein [Wickerhamomyces ciferrii]